MATQASQLQFEVKNNKVIFWETNPTLLFPPYATAVNYRDDLAITLRVVIAEARPEL